MPIIFAVEVAMKILVVDDEQLVRWFLERALRKDGHEVITASNIADAYEKLSSQDIDLLFVDLRMPEGNGLEVVKKVANSQKKVKIIVCSAFVTSELEDEFKDKGIYVLKKPFKLDELNSTVRHCLEG
jgi:two-component system response regulator PilR (NtrC family)